MDIGQVIRFHEERFFGGAVQLGWVQQRTALARQAADAFVFHGPRYHSADKTEHDGIESAYRLKDTASFVRDLLNSMQAGSEGREVNPYWLVVAGYGSGKSHMALTCASLLSEPDGEAAQSIVQHIARADAEIGETVAGQVAAMEKPVLVLPLDGMDRFHLDNALSSAVFGQLSRVGVSAEPIRDLSPRFQTAEQFVERNFEFRSGGFAERLSGLGSEQICARLRERDEDVYEAIDALYIEANGQPIPVDGQESAQALIETLCSVYCGPDGPFSHVVILFDEFGRYLEYAAEKPHLAGAAVLQEVFQGIQNNSNKVRFVGFIQYELKAYLKRFSGADLRQLQRYVTRFDAADKWYLSTNLETIFAHMIGKDEAALTQLWQQSDALRQAQLTWQRLSQCLPGFARFPVWSDEDRFGQVIARGCWPLHPFAVWFLTRQRDLVQSRSALTFIKDVIERIAGEEALTNGRLRQISAAELVVGNMLPELISAERETGGAIAETLQMLLEKLRGNLDARQERVLAGIAVLEKTRIGKQPRETADALLSEATALESESLPAVLASLSELGAVEWNGDLGRYELLSDGATRGQFQKWLRAQQADSTPDGIRDLFIRRGVTDIELTEIRPDFAHRREITTPDWFFEAQLAHANIVGNAIRSAFQQWRQATLPKDAKGKLIYLYLHPDDDVVTIGERVRACLAEELAKIRQQRAPIWVIGIADQGAIAEHIGRLSLFDERISPGDQERFRRFIPDECDRSRMVLKEAVEDAIKERLDWVAGFEKTPQGRLRAVGQEIFAQVYPSTVPFPFDGFGSAAGGGGAADAAQLARGLIGRQMSIPWIQTQPKRLQNRVNAVLVKSWKALTSAGKLTAPAAHGVNTLYKWLEQVHQDEPTRMLLTSYRQLIAPPYGLNASSAGLLLGLVLGLDSPPRRIEQGGKLVASETWIGHAFPSQRGRHHLDEAVLAESRLRFLSEDGESRWRGLLNRWEAEKNYQRKVEIGNEAEQMLKADPLPEPLEGTYKYLRDLTETVAVTLLEMRNRIGRWESAIEKAERRESVQHAIRTGSQVLHQRDQMMGNDSWPQGFVQECSTLIKFAQSLIACEIGNWLPKQTCHTATQVNEYRQRTEKEAKSLTDLGFEREAKALTRQAQHSIHTVEASQRFSEILGKSDQYPIQPAPTESTPVRTLRDEIAQGDMIIKGVGRAQSVLKPDQIAARVHAIKQRQGVLQSALKRQQDKLGSFYGLHLESEEAVREARTKANRLRDIFVDTADESEVNDLVMQLEMILADVAAWERGDVTVKRLDELLGQQIEHQLQTVQKFLEDEEIDAAWDLGGVYRALAAERVQAASRRSLEWVRPRLALATQVGQLDRAHCAALDGELKAAPAYLSEENHSQVQQLLELVQRRLAEVDELERSAKVTAWIQQFRDSGNIEQLDRHATEQLLKLFRNPPCELRADEQAQMVPVADQLTGHLDQMSVDELVARIERLSKSQRHQLLARLSAMLEIQSA